MVVLSLLLPSKHTKLQRSCYNTLEWYDATSRRDYTRRRKGNKPTIVLWTVLWSWLLKSQGKIIHIKQNGLSWRSICSFYLVTMSLDVVRQDIDIKSLGFPVTMTLWDSQISGIPRESWFTSLWDSQISGIPRDFKNLINLTVNL